MRTDRADAVIQQHALVIIEVPRIGVPAVEMARELQHVVRAAALGRVRTRVQLRSEAAGRAQPALGIARAPGDVRPRRGHFLEEIVGDIVKTEVAGDLVSPRGGNRLGDVRVGVQPPQLVTAERHGVDEALLLESVADPCPAVLARGRGEMVQRGRDAAEFDRENLLHVRFGLRRRPVIGPCGHALEHLKRLPVAGEPIHVEHAGHDLVDGVERRPDPLP